jgi:hypothetical protein
MEKYMRISKTTLSILKNFIKINLGIIIEPGNKIRSRSSAVYGEATVPETFPVEVTLPNLRNFLDVLFLFRDPVLEFAEGHVRMIETDGSGETCYPYGQPGSIKAIPKGLRAFDSSNEISFSLSEANWGKLQKAFRGRALGKTKYGRAPQYVTINSNGKGVQIGAGPRQSVSVGQYTIPVSAQTHGHECAMVFDADNLPLLGGDYAVTVRPVFTEFRQTKGPGVVYYVAAEPMWSSWGGKQEYRVIVTRTKSEDCTVLVQAHSPEEAKRIVQSKSTEEFTWNEKPGHRMDFMAAIASAAFDVEASVRG